MRGLPFSLLRHLHLYQRNLGTVLSALVLAPTLLLAEPPTKAAAPANTPAPVDCGAEVPGMGCVPAGPMIRGRDDGPKNERPAMSLWLQTFYMDRNEVTFAEYQACVRRKKCRPNRPIYSDFNHPRQPMVAVTWFDAVQYCRAVGKHLPTEAQWEKAARGERGELYPWGDEPVTCKQAVIMDHRGRSCGEKKRGAARLAHVGHTFRVPARPAYRYGLHDIIGNSWEWVADWYGDYATCGADCAGVDPKGPCGGAERCPGHKQKVLRGGSWYWEAALATGTYRRPYVPENKPTSHFGFRCAASPEEAAALRTAGKPAAR
jgi:formylglycine-generating enzyme required for sulfatase activity